MISNNKMVNEEALASAIYNPTVERSTILLYQIMDKAKEPAEEEVFLQEFESNFLALSTTNRYKGVLVNPMDCLIADVETDLEEVRDAMDHLASQRPDVAAEWNPIRDQFIQDTQEVTAGLAPVLDHTNRVSFNLSDLVGIAQAAMGLITAMSLLSNPCLGLSNFFGSIMDDAKALLRKIGSEVAKAKAAIAKALGDAAEAVGPVIQAIGEAMAAAKQAVAELTAMVAREIKNFAQAMLGMARQGLAQLLASLPQDPCLRSLMGSVVTGAAAVALG